MGDDPTNIAEPMDSFDVDLGVRRVRPRRLDVCDEVPGGEGCAATVVETHPIGRGSGYLPPVERGIRLLDDRPRLRIRRRLAREVPRVEFCCGRVKIVHVE